MGAGHGEERTKNMWFMSLTLEVSKLSGWLNANAYCRESEGEHIRCGASCGPGGGRRRATAVHAAFTQGRARLQIGSRAGEERTENMSRMFVTLEVSKLSGWLIADAYCRDERRAHDASEVRAAGGYERREGVGAAVAQTARRAVPD